MINLACVLIEKCVDRMMQIETIFTENKSDINPIQHIEPNDLSVNNNNQQQHRINSLNQYQQFGMLLIIHIIHQIYCKQIHRISSSTKIIYTKTTVISIRYVSVIKHTIQTQT